MILKNNLYTALRTETRDGRLCYDLRLLPDSLIYQAHFPGEPITPGVCIIQMACELLQDHLGRPLQLTTVKNVKFLSVISPLETPELTYVFDKVQSDDTTIRTQITVRSSETEFAKLSLIF
jgi:3-hydroxyacyl-[acyl-carrier-protein] dehydratase